MGAEAQGSAAGAIRDAPGMAAAAVPAMPATVEFGSDRKQANAIGGGS